MKDYYLDIWNEEIRIYQYLKENLFRNMAMDQLTRSLVIPLQPRMSTALQWQQISLDFPPPPFPGRGSRHVL